jgi:predicted nucleic acid-binding Zn ribbon protein
MNTPRRHIPKLGAPPSSARQRVLAQWRGIDLSSAEKTRAARTKAPSDVMPKVLKRIGLDRRQVEAEVLRVWTHLIDPVIVAHAQPTGLVRGTLFVTVDSNTWHAEIVRYRRREILERLQHSFGPDLIARISFRVG